MSEEVTNQDPPVQSDPEVIIGVDLATKPDVQMTILSLDKRLIKLGNVSGLSEAVLGEIATHLGVKDQSEVVLVDSQVNMSNGRLILTFKTRSKV